jgi:hypothetical protein
VRKLNIPEPFGVWCIRTVIPRVPLVVQYRPKHLKHAAHKKESGTECKACKDWQQEEISDSNIISISSDFRYNLPNLDQPCLLRKFLVLMLTFERISPWMARSIIRVSPVINEYVRIMGRFACPTTLASGSSHSRSSETFSENLASVDKLALDDRLKVGDPKLKVDEPNLGYEGRSPGSGRSRDTVEFA